MTGEEIRGALIQLIALIILAMPLFLLPAALKLSAGILGRINDMTRSGVKRFGGDQLDGLGKKGRGAVGSAIGRGARDKAVALGRKSDKWGTTEDKDGKKVRKKGFRGAFGYGAGRIISGATLYPTKRREMIADQQREAKRVQEERMNALIAERNPDGTPTKRAESYAKTAAGAGGSEGAERIKQLATERMLKDYNDEVGRRNKSLGLDNFFIHETAVNQLDDKGEVIYEKDTQGNFKKDAQGNKIKKRLGMHERLAAMSNGKTLTWEGQHGQVTVSGKDDYWKEAAMLQIATTGDSKAISATITGDKYAYKTKADGSYDLDASGQKQAIYEKDASGAFKLDSNGQKIQEIKNPDLLDSKSARTLTKYLQSSSGVRAAFPHLIKSEGGAFGNPNANNMKSYHVDEARINFEWATEQARKGQPLPLKTLHEEFQKAMISENWDSMPVDTRRMFESLLNMNAIQIRQAAGLAVPGQPGGQQSQQANQQTQPTPPPNPPQNNPPTPNTP